jgi:hypothetical protein
MQPVWDSVFLQLLMRQMYVLIQRGKIEGGGGGAGRGVRGVPIIINMPIRLR